VDIPRLREWSLRGNALRKDRIAFLFRVEYFETSEQLGSLKQISNTLGQIAELDGASGVVSRRVESHQCTQPSRINVVDPAQVEKRSGCSA